MVTNIVENWLWQRSIDRNDHPALIFDNQVWTFTQLENISIQVAINLKQLGVKPKDYVAVLADNSPNLIILIHALIKLRCVSVHLNIRLSEQELRWQFDNINSTFLVHDSSKFETVNRLLIPDSQLLNLEDLVNRKFELNQNLLSNYIDLNHIHTIIYTSGTTGVPKGVQLTYQNHLASAIASYNHLKINPNSDRWLNCLPLYHIGGLSILWRSVIWGMPMVLLSKFDVYEVCKAIATQEITFISLVPTMLFRILASPDFQNTLEPWQNLRGILLGGASSNQELLNQCLELKLPILLTYGLTEATSQVATLSTEDIPSKIGSSGQVLSCNQVRIISLENDRVEVEIGAIGQILIKGDNLMKGYLNYPNLEDNWFNTGDIGYLDNAGYLYVLNRRHDLIISGGENIYPPEIESVLLKHPHIQDACIVGITDQEWGEIVAAVLQVSDRSINLDSVREFCIGEGLARYKLPKRIYIVDSMPTTASGKVSRQLIRDLITNLVS